MKNICLTTFKPLESKPIQHDVSTKLTPKKYAEMSPVAKELAVNEGSSVLDVPEDSTVVVVQEGATAELGCGLSNISNHLTVCRKKDKYGAHSIVPFPRCPG